jgi:hypothetical protein
MHADEADAPRTVEKSDPTGNLGLTNLKADLSWNGNDHIDSQGNYDYHAHAQVYEGGADPLGSQGFAGELRNPSSS